jgi:hypothetical protein
MAPAGEVRNRNAVENKIPKENGTNKTLCVSLRPHSAVWRSTAHVTKYISCSCLRFNWSQYLHFECPLLQNSLLDPCLLYRPEDRHHLATMPLGPLLNRTCFTCLQVSLIVSPGFQSFHNTPPAFFLSELPVTIIPPEGVRSPQQDKSNGRTVNFSLWTGTFWNRISSIPDETVTPLRLSRRCLVCGNRGVPRDVG